MSIRTEAPREPAPSLVPATRRALLATLTSIGAAAALPAPFGSPRAQAMAPSGEAGAELAATVIAAAWSKPTGLVLRMHHAAAASRLRLLLRSYAQVHLARTGGEATASHMLSVAEVITRGRRSWSELEAWLDEERRGFRTDRFALAWRQARMLDLARGAQQRARLRAYRLAPGPGDASPA